MARPVGDLGPIFRLVYRSHAKIPAEHREAELTTIFEFSRWRNAAVGVTGALLVWRDAFVQVLEGDELTVRGLYDAIESDSRHEYVELLDADTVPDRMFGAWAMARIGDAEGVDIPVRDDRPPGDEQVTGDARRDTMLGLMREYARLDVEPR